MKVLEFWDITPSEEKDESFRFLRNDEFLPGYTSLHSDNNRVNTRSDVIIMFTRPSVTGFRHSRYLKMSCWLQ